MPEPRRGESMSDYMHRFMGSKEAEKSFPKRKQRVAVGMSVFRRAKRKRK